MVMSIVRCCLEFADAQFSRGDAEALARDRTLYATAQDLLNLPEVKPETGSSVPLTPNPIWESLQLHAEPFQLPALVIRKKALGAEHPDVAQNLHNLAWLYFNQGK